MLMPVINGIQLVITGIQIVLTGTLTSLIWTTQLQETEVWPVNAGSEGSEMFDDSTSYDDSDDFLYQWPINR